MQTSDGAQEQLKEIEVLKDKLREYEETLNAIRNGEVDALLVAGKKGEQVYTLKGAEHPYRAFIEHMSEGAVTLNSDGVILYCNPRFGAMMKESVETLIGGSVLDKAASPQDLGILRDFLNGKLGENNQAEITLRSADASSFPAKISVSGLTIEEALTFCMVVTDLTERRQKEEFRALAENSPDSILRINRQMRVVYANPAAETAFGGGVIGKAISELSGYIPENALWQEQARHTFATAKTARFIFQYAAPHEEKCIFDARIVPELNNKGQVVSSLTIARDITRLKETEQHLNEAVDEAKLRAEQAEEGRNILEALMQNIQEGIMITDADGNIRSISNYLARVTGVQAQDVIGGSMDVIDFKLGELGIPGAAPGSYPLVRAIKHGETTLGEERTIRSSDGARITVLINSRPICNREGGIIGGLTAWRDITERKKAEDSLRRNEYELRTVVDNSPDLIFRLNRQGEYVYVNPAYERITGLSKERFIGRTNSQLGMPQQMVEFWQSAVQPVLEGGREHPVEFDLKSLFGTRYFYARIIPEFQKSGLVETVLVIARDITERRHAEEQIRYISFHDEVTGLFNRAFFEEEIRRVDTERDMPVSIIMGDVNNLKLMNDVYGHDEGDRLLKIIAEVLRKACRKNDILARWGGDEFAVILPRTDNATAIRVCRRIKEITAEQKGTVIPPGISLGTTTKDNREQNIYRTIRQAEEKMYQNKLDESGRNEANVYAALTGQARERKSDRDAHVSRSLVLADRFGKELSLCGNEMDDLRLLIRLHDIGDAVLPPEILAKPGRLTDQEWEIMKKHVETDFRIARTFADTARIADEILAHNERWDGTGYPRGLKARGIPRLARIFAVIDAFDAMTHPRPYASVFSPPEAVEELRRNAGKQFDPDLVDRFAAVVSPRQEAPA